MNSPSTAIEATEPRTEPEGDSGDRVLLRTTRFGDLVVDETATFTLVEGMPGFSDMTALLMLPVDADAMFVWLQSIRDGAVAFLAVNPWPFFADYEIEIGDAHLESLGVVDVEDMVVFCLARPDRERHAFHVNLLAPLVFGLRSMRARQIVLDADHPIDAVLQMPDSTAIEPRVRPAPMAERDDHHAEAHP